jgi:hypothetical protein
LPLPAEGTDILYSMQFFRAVQKENFEQPFTAIALPKALKSSFIAVFDPLAGQKLHYLSIFVPLAGL